MVSNVRTNNFWHQIADAAGRVLDCETCKRGAMKYGLMPQPGWVGPSYRGIVFLLQNPAVPKSNYGESRQDETQSRLHTLAQNPTTLSYEQYSSETIRDVIGDGVNRHAWSKWTHPVNKIIDDPNVMAWMNVVKFPTPGKKRKDDPVEKQDVCHGIACHLTQELKILQPDVVITIGSDASHALDQIPQMWRYRFHLKGRASSNIEAASIRQELIHVGQL